MKHLFLNRLILLMLALVSGCGNERVDPQSAAQETEAAARLPASEQSGAPKSVSTFPVTVKDDRGQDVTIAQPPQRMISLLPSHTETLFALGAGKQMVGCTSHCNYPPETKDLKQIALANPGSISLEALVELQPDLIVLGGDYHRELAAQLTKLQIPVLSFESQSVADIERSIRGLSRATGHTQAGETLIEKIKAEIAAVQKQIAPFQKTQRPRVFYRVWDQPLMTAGPHSFIGELMTLAGGENVFADVEPAYPQVSEETLILRNPEVMLIPRMKSAEDDPKTIIEKLSQRPGWAEMEAIQNQRVYLIEDDLISRPGPRVVQGLQKIAQALYPEAFPHP